MVNTVFYKKLLKSSEIDSPFHPQRLDSANESNRIDDF